MTDEAEEATEELMEAISDVADDIQRFSQKESAEIYEFIASRCTQRAELIRSEMS